MRAFATMRVPRRHRLRLRELPRALALGVFLLAPAALAGAAMPAPVEFWVVEPNEGDSAGGHVAVRIGERLYHVERRADGLIADRRTRRAVFEDVYRGAGNRGILAIPLALDAGERSQLRSKLESRFFGRSRSLERLDGLEAEAEFLDAAVERAPLRLEVPGAGLLESVERAGCDRAGAAHAAGFGAELERRHGEGWIATRLAQAEAEARRSTRRLLAAQAEAAEASDGGPAGGDLARLIIALQSRAAWQALASCALPQPGRLIPVDLDRTGSAASAALLDPIRAALEARLHALVVSRRRDVGLAILLTWARWSAVVVSIESGRLHLLDPLAEAEASHAATRLEGGLSESLLAVLRARQVERLEQAVRGLARGDGPLEARLVDLELAHHRLAHLRTRSLHAPPRALPGTIGSHARRYAAREVRLAWPVGVAPASLDSRRRLARARARSERDALERELAYSLLLRNCVTELTSVLDEVTRAGARPSARRELRSLGLARAVDFVPVVAGQLVAERLSDGAPRQLPNARAALIARSDTARSFWGRLRELTPLTSRSYRPNPADSSFLLFTRERIWARPLMGIANLAYATGSTAVGLLTAPFDRGRGLRRGGQGILMTLPELFFFNVRQGSYPLVPPTTGALDASGARGAGPSELARSRD